MNARFLASGAALLSAATLLGAFGFQYIGGLAPCHLCLLERYPHGIAFAIGLAALFAGNRWLFVLGGVVMVYSAGLAGYHVGVEQHWWQGPTSCTSSGISGLSNEELMAQILAAPLVRCDDIPWSLFQISMAGWNGLVSIGLAAMWLVAFKQS